MNNAHKFLETMLGISQMEEKNVGIQGILQTKDYNDFVILSDMGNEIYKFTGAKLANKCLVGDHVRWENDRCELELRDEHPPIVGTIELTNKSKYGLTSRGVPIYLFTPYDKRYPHFITGCSEKNITKNRIGIIKFDTWEETSTFPRGLLQQIFGISGDYEAEKQALIWQACPWKYPKYSYNPELKTKTERKQIKGFTFNIDPQGCKDIDDVLTFEKMDDYWKVIITIADVASYVEDGSAVAIMASLIGQTLYDNDGKVLRSMLPTEYSENACSLVPNKESIGVSLRFIWTGAEIKDIEWFESSFENNKSYTYEEFQESDSPYRVPLSQIASYLANETISDSHKWIEQMMIFYNVQAGKVLKESKMGILRRHSQPNLERLQKYREYLPELEKLAFSSAEYCLAEETETTHYGLNTSTYAHTTSPIRRYADLVNQRVLKLVITQNKYMYIVPQAMYDMNVREKAIKGFSRNLDFLNALSTGKNEFEGVIIDKIIKLNNKVKVKVYVFEWKKTVSSEYELIDENRVLSKDEKQIIDITDFRKIKVRCTFNFNGRNWKERAIFYITT